MYIDLLLYSEISLNLLCTNIRSNQSPPHLENSSRIQTHTHRKEKQN